MLRVVIRLIGLTCTDLGLKLWLIPFNELGDNGVSFSYVRRKSLLAVIEPGTQGGAPPLSPTRRADARQVGGANHAAARAAPGQGHAHAPHEGGPRHAPHEGSAPSAWRGWEHS